MLRLVGLLILPASVWGAAILAALVHAGIMSLSSAYGIVALFLAVSTGCCAIAMVVLDVTRFRLNPWRTMPMAERRFSSMAITRPRMLLKDASFSDPLCDSFLRAPSTGSCE